jgi:hypothetical protein
MVYDSFNWFGLNGRNWVRNGLVIGSEDVVMRWFSFIWFGRWHGICVFKELCISSSRIKSIASILQVCRFKSEVQVSVTGVRNQSHHMSNIARLMDSGIPRPMIGKVKPVCSWFFQLNRLRLNSERL